MRKSPILAIAATAMATLLAAGIAVAPAAQAYPPGKQQKTTLNKAEVRQDGRFKAEVRNAQPGCRVRFALLNASGREVDSRAGRADESGYVMREFSPAPSKPGDYTLVATTGGAGCVDEESSADITVIRR